MKKKTSDPLSTLKKYQLEEFITMFTREEADKLPEHGDYDHEIRIEPNSKMQNKKTYGLPRMELEAAKIYIDDMLEKGFIRPSSSPVASPIILVKRPGGGLRFCVDYRALNAITIKNRYPIPRVQEMLARLCRAKFFTKFDIISIFNNIRIKKRHE